MRISSNFCAHPEVREKVEAAIAQAFGRRYSVEVIRL